MKKLITTSLILVMAFVSNIYSQEIILGIKGGSTSSGLLYSKFSQKPDQKLGFLLGLNLLKPISPHMDLGTELVYEQKGYVDHIIFSDQNGINIGTGKYIFMLDYIALPCYIRIHTTNKIQWFFNFGIYPSYLVNSITDVPIINTNNGTITSKKVKFDASYLRRLDVGGLIGGGALLNITDKLIIDLNLRYNNGFLSIFDKQAFDQYMLLNSLNLSIGLNYKITAGNK